MIKTLLMLSFVSIFSLTALAGGKGGATVVGDGGHVLVCPEAGNQAQVRFFDLVEYSLERGPAAVTLGANLSVRDQVNVALQRTAARFQLSPDELQPLKRVSAVFFGLSFDPWSNPAITETELSYLDAQPIQVSQLVYNSMQEQGCHLEVAIVKPNLKDGDPVVYRNICRLGFAETENCLLKNNNLYRHLTNGEKACLVLHETLRYLPLTKAPASEREMRRVAAEICTSHL